MKPQIKLAAAVFVAAAVSACTTLPTKIQSRVTVFHQMPATPTAGDTYVVLPWRNEHQGSLEHQAYAQQVADQLKSRGMTVAAPGSPAKFGVFVDFGIDDGRIETSSYAVPNFGVTGYAGSQTTGTVNRVGNTAYVNSTTVATPTYGVTGYNQVSRSTRVFKRFLNVDIVDLTVSPDNPRKVYQATLKSDGQCGNLPLLMPIFVRAMFSEFPGASGRSGTVEMPSPPTC